DFDLGIEILLMLDDDGGDAAAGFVQLALHRHAGDHVLERERAALFREHGHVVGIPLGENLGFFNLLAVTHVEERADHDVVGLKLLFLGVDDLDGAGLVEDDVAAVGGLDEAEAARAHDAAGPDADFGRLESAGGDTADMEGAHGQLGAGLADRLGGDDADGVADLGEPVGGGIDAVALGVDAEGAGRGERRHDFDALEAGILDLAGDFLGDEVAGADEQFGGVQRIVDVVARAASDDALAQADDFVVTLENGLFPDAVAGGAIVLADDDVHGHVAEFAREVAGVGGLEGGVGQALAGAVGGDEVFEHGQALAEGRENRPLNDFAGGLGHQAAGAAELAHLLLVAARARVHHDVDGIDLEYFIS